ncbi:MAG: cell division protein ZapE [Pseudomonadota bacterium]
MDGHAGETGSTAVLDHYDRLVADEALTRDPAQVAVACALDDLADDLAAARKGGPLPFFRRRLGRARVVRGLYVHGSVGRGKTMLMDLFYEVAPVARKRRLHFNAFMDEVHKGIDTHRKAGSDNAVFAAANDVAAKTRLLCFDEFAVTDIADAMILSRFFTRLFKKRVTLVATSNVAPEDLYEGGLNRPLFEPFIRLLNDNVDVVRLDANADYRLNRMENRRVYFPIGDVGFERTWVAMLGERDERAVDVAVGSRAIAAPRAAGGMARFTFEALCDRPHSARDFLAVANRFHTLFLEGVPVMAPREREIVRRFINLIDVLYDQSVRLVVSAAAEPKALFDASAGGAKEEAFAFARTASRLYEMRSASYLHGIETTPYG